MPQSTGDRNYMSTEDYLRSAEFSGIPKSIFLATLNILVSMTAILGNVLIIAALPKVSFLHSLSKLLFRCVAFSHLRVVLISPLKKFTARES